jgi:hypothetical protein
MLRLGSCKWLFRVRGTDAPLLIGVRARPQIQYDLVTDASFHELDSWVRRREMWIFVVGAGYAFGHICGCKCGQVLEATFRRVEWFCNYRSGTTVQISPLQTRVEKRALH